MISGIDPRLEIARRKVVGSEELLVTQFVGRTLTVLRAQNGTLPGTHAAGDLIRLDRLWRAGDYDQAQIVLPFSGQHGEAVPFSVYVRDDGLVELDETLGVRLVNLQAEGRYVELGPSAVALILSDEPPDPIPGEDEEEERDDPPCIPADGGGETNPPEPGSSPPPGWFPADWTPELRSFVTDQVLGHATSRVDCPAKQRTDLHARGLLGEHGESPHAPGIVVEH